MPLKEARIGQREEYQVEGRVPRPGGRMRLSLMISSHKACEHVRCLGRKLQARADYMSAGKNES